MVAFDEPLQSLGWKIECLELPYPAEAKFTQAKIGNMSSCDSFSAQTADEYLADP